MKSKYILEDDDYLFVLELESNGKYIDVDTSLFGLPVLNINEKGIAWGIYMSYTEPVELYILRVECKNDEIVNAEVKVMRDIEVCKILWKQK